MRYAGLLLLAVFTVSTVIAGDETPQAVKDILEKVKSGDAVFASKTHFGITEVHRFTSKLWSDDVNVWSDDVNVRSVELKRWRFGLKRWTLRTTLVCRLLFVVCGGATNHTPLTTNGARIRGRTDARRFTIPRGAGMERQPEARNGS